MTIMLNNQQRAGLTGMIREDLKSGGILVWPVLENCEIDVYDLVVQYCIVAVMPSRHVLYMMTQSSLTDRAYIA
jgi:hypothetical protein